MKHLYLLLLLGCLLAISCKTDPKPATTDAMEANSKDLVSETPSKENSLSIHPISHATMALTYGNDVIYVDPTGGAQAFKGLPMATTVLITDIHGDHFDLKTLSGLNLSKATVIAPKAVADLFPEDLKTGKTVVLNNDDAFEVSSGFSVKAIPMYNLREEALQFHSKGRGNGYVLTLGGERIYISGDTEDIPEMRALQQIDKAFVCMNLPWTMTVDKAAEAVMEFKPKTVYPYHYRGKDGMSDVKKFKTLINQGDESIEVIQLDWYN
ncbi:MBL fold metallo-hydrolase [Psychroserpens sp. SPM9]|uniref:MBL fold metallo-hydrolase n=1 Tax=Psychroserpens sp. SPM9 TaxID=2975598 RepID=UPI0021A3459A|nr:MBL fold metallo-hydrolase [Psychroserpens sp. SPM9]MDG5491864.1 MBL fold metallo-hydrolase [Psychroserpens sp. SPM9]